MDNFSIKTKLRTSLRTDKEKLKFIRMAAKIIKEILLWKEAAERQLRLATVSFL
jgi:hypothetical protein